MTKAKTKDTDAADEIRCDAKDDDGAQCLYVEHDDSVEHAFSKEAAEQSGATGDPEHQLSDTETSPTPAAAVRGAEIETPLQPNPADVAAAAAAEPRHEPALPSRTSVNAWWCANCDTSSPHETKVCPKCGTPRAGQTAHA